MGMAVISADALVVAVVVVRAELLSGLDRQNEFDLIACCGLQLIPCDGADDAMAIDQLMTLKMGDAGADRVLQAAEAVESEGLRVAPGTAAITSAAAYVAALQSQAHMQKMIGGQLRQEAARLAHETMGIKRGAAFTRETRGKVTDLNK